MDISALLRQDVVNTLETFTNLTHEQFTTLFIAIALSSVVLFFTHLFINKHNNPNRITQKVCMQMNYTYHNVRYTTLYINERLDKKLNITNESGQVMFCSVEDAYSVSKIIMGLKKGKYRKINEKNT